MLTIKGGGLSPGKRMNEGDPGLSPGGGRGGAVQLQLKHSLSSSWLMQPRRHSGIAGQMPGGSHRQLMQPPSCSTILQSSGHWMNGQTGLGTSQIHSGQPLSPVSCWHASGQVSKGEHSAASRRRQEHSRQPWVPRSTSHPSEHSEGAAPQSVRATPSQMQTGQVPSARGTLWQPLGHRRHSSAEVGGAAARRNGEEQEC